MSWWGSHEVKQFLFGDAGEAFSGIAWFNSVQKCWSSQDPGWLSMFFPWGMGKMGHVKTWGYTSPGLRRLRVLGFWWAAPPKNIPIFWSKHDFCGATFSTKRDNDPGFLTDLGSWSWRSWQRTPIGLVVILPLWGLQVTSLWMVHLGESLKRGLKSKVWANFSWIKCRASKRYHEILHTLPF